ncbi:acetyl-CoA synthetase-like protein, partial [Colletotrichum somersetense]
MATANSSTTELITPFSLLPVKQPTHIIREQAASCCCLMADQIKDIFPCTPLQKGLLAMTAKHAGRYVARNIFPLKQEIHAKGLVEAWNKVVAANDILRTRIVDLPEQGLVQVVIDTASSPCIIQQSLYDYTKAEEAHEIKLGETLSRAVVLVDNDGARYLVWTIHHALYDGWSMPLLLAQLETAYHSGSISPISTPFQAFIRNITTADLQSTRHYWQAQLADCEAVPFPPLPSASYQPQANQLLQHAIKLHWPQKDVTPSTILRTAWAIVISRHTGSDDVVFGAVSNGRQAPVPGIERITGPTITTMPVRVRLQDNPSVSNLLAYMQLQAIEMVPHEQFGLSNVRKLGPGATQACQFQSLFVLQPKEEALDSQRFTLFELHKAAGFGNNVGQFVTYALMVTCKLNDQGIALELRYDATVVAPALAKLLAEQFDQVLRQLCKPEMARMPIDEIETTREQDLRHIWAWNASVPETVKACVHDLFTKRARQQPDAPAICAWNGELTYCELDVLSTRLAHHLAALGARPGTIVPLCFEKSMWTSVAMLAVMKAGAASVAMDTTQPASRLRAIVQQTLSHSSHCQLILSSKANQTLASELAGPNVPVIIAKEEAAQDPRDNDSQPPLAQATPDDLLYIVFTSGSTGVPKGVMITHANFSSAVQHQRRVLGFTAQTRVFDYVSYAFDVAWSNVVHTFVAGGCLCVPNNESRFDSIAESINKLGATYAYLTPTIAQLISAGDVPLLQTLAITGEKLTRSVALHWENIATPLNLYGPAEVTVTATASPIRAGEKEDPVIGKGCGTVVWVVRPDGKSLVSVGDIGELWLEGPLVGQGYLGDPEKTTAAFVNDPAWLIRGGPGVAGRRGRLYRTGDLVRYDADGVLHFVGRKDDQVKIRGQRVELGEIEYQVKQALPDLDGSQIVAEVVVPSSGHQAIVVVFVCLPGDWDNSEAIGHGELAAAVDSFTAGLTEKLLLQIPAYMVPSLYIPIPNIPLSATGKVDRRRLRQMAADLDLASALRPTVHNRKAPATEVESVLASVWAEVLNLSQEDVSTNVTFLKLGGDSISAMQVVSRCRSKGFRFLVGDILRHQAIEKIAPYGRQIYADIARSAEVEVVDGQPWDLSPIQQTFFANHPDGLNHYNQSFLLRLNGTTSAAELETMAQTLVRRHPMLRARFQRSHGGSWKQYVAPGHQNALSFREHPPTQETQISSMVQQRQESLDITKGPVFALDYIPIKNGGTILILFTAHHLIIDLVSWRILWQDMEQLWRGRENPSTATTSFRQWCRLLRQEIRDVDPAQTVPFQLSGGFESWGVTQSDNIVSAARNHDVWIDRETTSLLMNKCNQFLRTEPIEIMVAVLLHSLKTTFPERPTPAIWLEGHGREPLTCADTDVSETIGWFTTMYPVQIATHEGGGSLVDTVKLVKDTHRQIPMKGLSFFASHASSGADEFERLQQAEFLLNYAGVYQQLESNESMFSRVPSDITAISALARRTALVEINGHLQQGKLNLKISVHKQMNQFGLMEEWVGRLGEQFRTAMAVLASQPPMLSLSDVPLLQTSDDELERMTARLRDMGIALDDVANIFPCTPLQQGILLGINRGSASYNIVNVWRCEISLDSEVAMDAETLERAWRHVIARHSIFSTIFLETGDSQGFVQVQLRDAPMRVERLRCDGNHPEEFLRNVPGLAYGGREAAYAVTICQAPDGAIACRLDISHAMFDAAALPILLADVAKACGNHQPVRPAPEFSQVVEQIFRRSPEDRVGYWCQYLAQAQRCIIRSSRISNPQNKKQYRSMSLPIDVTAGIQGFCQTHDITRSSFIQVAWAMVLSHLTGMRDVCFGYLASGRDMPIDGIDEIVGPLINLLIARIRLDAPTADVLSATMKHTTDHFNFQHVSLAELQHQLGLRGESLFNTVVTVRQARGSEHEALYGIRFIDVHGEDPNEFDIAVGVELNKAATNIALSFRSDAVDERLASDAVHALTMGIRYLLQTGKRDEEKLLYDSFFENMTGIGEAQAKSIWGNLLSDIEAVRLPALAVPTYDVLLEDRIQHEIPDICMPESPAAIHAVLWTAWALVVADKANVPDVVFGGSTQGQYLEKGRPELLPVRIKLSDNMPVQTALEQAMATYDQLTKVRHIGLDWVRRLDEQGKQAGVFQSSFVVSIMDDSASESGERTLETYDDLALRVEVEAHQNSAVLTFGFDSRQFDDATIRRMGQQFEQVTRQLCRPDMHNMLVSEIETTSKMDLQQIWAWNAVVPETVEDCVHNLFAERARQQPDAPAICAWDGNLTYGELDALSTRLAYRLAALGAGPGTIVPLCFEKSMWTSVAMLGVMKAGAASAAMDTTQPASRLRAIVQQTLSHSSHPLILSSVANRTLAGELVNGMAADVPVIVIAAETAHGPADESKQPPLAQASPQDLLCIVFTSGSTGVPKGAILTHANFSSAIRYQQDLPLIVSSRSRVFDFASYAFDAAWHNLLCALTAGATLCVPNQEERLTDLSGAIQRYNANYILLPPTAARLLGDSSLNCLETVVLGGEVMLASDVAIWSKTANAFNIYGPAECTVLSTAQRLDVSTGYGSPGIGRGCGTVIWVVRPHGKGLVSIGETGELWIEGPLVGRGYLGDPDKTAAAFIEDPAWLVRGGPGSSGRHGRLYRTGDLVRYDTDGVLHFVGRKDDQVKIRGQRVELGEIEHHLRQCLDFYPDFSVDVLADVIRPEGSKMTMLVAFLALGDAAEDNTTLQRVIADINAKLGDRLPTHMVPGAFIPINCFPMTATGKTDRIRLRERGAAMTLEQLAALNTAWSQGGSRTAPTTEAELQLQRLWADVLGISPDAIAAEDSFLRIGGDSVAAMRLVGRAREHGLLLTVTDIFQSLRLSDLA